MRNKSSQRRPRFDGDTRQVGPAARSRLHEHSSTTVHDATHRDGCLARGGSLTDAATGVRDAGRFSRARFRTARGHQIVMRAQ